ncbi:MAG: DUF2059 domain-containing protein [Flavobacteriaceae bacterium]
MKSSFLTIFFLVCFSGMAQVDDFQKDIIDFLNINGSRAEYSEAYYEVFPKLERNFKDKEIPAEAWETLKNDEKQQVDKVLSKLAFAYRKYFTQEDIKEMIEFYSTSAAQKTLADKTLSEKEEKELKAYLKTDVAKKFDKNRKEIKKDIDVIAYDWSKELFAAKMKELIKAGYLK